MKDNYLDKICALIQNDIGGRGLQNVPGNNLLTASVGDYQSACRNMADTPNLSVAIVTGFYISHASPPAAETDGPLGALFLARFIISLGGKAVLVTDAWCQAALEAGLRSCGLEQSIDLIVLPAPEPASQNRLQYVSQFYTQVRGLTHLVAIERAGPNHTLESLESQAGASSPLIGEFATEISNERRDRCYSMRGVDITRYIRPAHWLFEEAKKKDVPPVTIGIGDGGNELGMGKISWDVIRRNINRGSLIACRVPTDYLVVSGISNWGAYGLAAGVNYLMGRHIDKDLFNVARERSFLEVMVQKGILVDGMSGKPALAVDGFPFERYAEPLRQLARGAI